MSCLYLKSTSLGVDQVEKGQCMEATCCLETPVSVTFQTAALEECSRFLLFLSNLRTLMSLSQGGGLQLQTTETTQNQGECQQYLISRTSIQNDIRFKQPMLSDYVNWLVSSLPITLFHVCGHLTRDCWGRCKITCQFWLSFLLSHCPLKICLKTTEQNSPRNDSEGLKWDIHCLRKSWQINPCFET